MKNKLSSIFFIILLAIVSVALLTGCGSGDVAIRGRLVENGTGLSNMWIILADNYETDDGYSGYKIKLSSSYQLEHLWTGTDLDGSWQINIPADKAKELGATVLVVAPVGQIPDGSGSYTDISASGLREFSSGVRSGVARGQAIKKDGSPIKWGPGKLRGTINLGDIQVQK